MYVVFKLNDHSILCVCGGGGDISIVKCTYCVTFSIGNAFTSGKRVSCKHGMCLLGEVGVI